MIRYNGIYIATQGKTVSAAGSLLELQVPTGTIAEVIRLWIGAALDNENYVEQIALYKTPTAISGSGVSENLLRGTDDATAACTVVTAGGSLTGETTLSKDSFHTQNGWLWSPLPDERPRIIGGSAFDNFGIEFVDTPGEIMTLPYGIVWGEIG